MSLLLSALVILYGYHFVAMIQGIAQAVTLAGFPLAHHRPPPAVRQHPRLRK